jgi:UDP-N-acetylmuramoyl-L-alanyl-D-glutamate--2,6-diaminopimelate ligase
MGAVARRLADWPIVTTDNPRSEDPAAIIVEITAGFEMDTELDRTAAIARAFDGAQRGDVVVIAGKGHEQGQQFAEQTLPFDDRDVARAALEALATR